MSEHDNISEFAGDEMTVQWHGGLCIHIGECGRAEGELFVGGRDPWCNPDLSDRETIDDIIRRCPTGALTYTDHRQELAEHAEPENVIIVSNNGPLYVRGDLDIEGQTPSMPGVRFRAALCRCGASKNKPFCDGSHEAAGFKDYGAVGASGDAELADRGGTLSITIAPKGPLLLRGNAVIIAASGREAWRGTKAALCRCGASKNKPFCDGSHTAIGFEVEQDKG